MHKTNTLTIDRLEEDDFISNNETILGFGFVPDTSVWVRFTLKNSTGKPLKKVLEYVCPETESVYFYDGKRIEHDGMWYMKEDRKHTNPHFEITLEPEEERVFYIKAHAPITSLVVQLTLWNDRDLPSQCSLVGLLP